MTPPPPLAVNFLYSPHWQSIFYTPLLGVNFLLSSLCTLLTTTKTLFNPCENHVIPQNPPSPSTQAVDNGWSLRKKKIKKTSKPGKITTNTLYSRGDNVRKFKHLVWNHSLEEFDVFLAITRLKSLTNTHFPLT